MSIRCHIPGNDQPDPLTATEMLGHLVSERAFGAAQELLSNLDADEFGYVVEEVGMLLSAQGVESPAWQDLSEFELRKIASGAFHLQNGKVVLLGEA
jgi:hypothetical protein